MRLLTRYPLSIGAAAALLAGCGGPGNSVPPISHSGQPPGKSVAFNASFAGTWAEFSACNRERINRYYTRNGSASLLGKSNENGITSVSSCNHPLSKAGQFILRDLKNQDSITLDVTTTSRGFSQWYVKRGTGAFAQAKGLLKWTLTDKTHHRYADKWTGKISLK